MNLYQRINEVRKSIEYIQKDKSVSTGGGSYKAVTHDQVTAMVREHMVKHGIICYPNLVSSLMNPKEVNAAMEQAKQNRYEATYDFTFVNIDEPAEHLTIRIEAHAMDNADKAPGKALSYAKKYAVLKLFEIETGDEEESRYQQTIGLSQEQIELFILKIKTESNPETKKELFKQAMTACKEINDLDSANAIKEAVKI